MQNKRWFYISMTCLIISVVSLFISIVTYTTPAGDSYSYNIVGLLFQGHDFSQRVLNSYTGPVFATFTGVKITAMAAIAIIAFICAFTGLMTIRAQYPTTGQFILTFLGLIGTAVPSVLILILVFLSRNYFIGTVSCGLAPIITPIAMIISIITVKRRKDKVAEELRRRAMAKGLIRRATDMDLR